MYRRNLISSVALSVVKAGFTGSSIAMPTNMSDFKLFLDGVYDVPEKPEYFEPNCFSVQDEIAVLVSGGLDSTACYFMAKSTGKKIVPIYINIGQDYATKELEAIRNIGIKDINVVDLSAEFNKADFKYDWKHILPARNFLFISLAAEMIVGGDIYFGVLDGEIKDVSGGDKSDRFLSQLETYFKSLPYQVKIKTPLKNMTKGQVVQWMLDNNLESELYNSITCFDDSSEKHCGKCQACFRKWLAFECAGADFFRVCSSLNLEHFLIYAEKYYKKMTLALKDCDFSEYSKSRCKEDLGIINKFFSFDKK